jgi:hypothetical protein
VGVGHVRIGNGIERRATSAMGAFGHLAYAVDNIYDTCNAFMARGVLIRRVMPHGLYPHAGRHLH